LPCAAKARNRTSTSYWLKAIVASSSMSLFILSPLLSARRLQPRMLGFGKTDGQRAHCSSSGNSRGVTALSPGNRRSPSRKSRTLLVTITVGLLPQPIPRCDCPLHLASSAARRSISPPTCRRSERLRTTLPALFARAETSGTDGFVLEPPRTPRTRPGR
jgi:hypothetical protein